MSNAEESRDNLNLCVKHETHGNKVLCPAVEEDNYEGEQEVDCSNRILCHSENLPDSIVTATGHQ